MSEDPRVILEDDPTAISVVKAIKEGDLKRLKEFLDDDPDLAAARITPETDGSGRTLLHIATDWPGHFPKVAVTIRLLLAAGADPNAGISGPGTESETALHWAASSNDVAAIDALLDGGASMDAQGAVIAGGDPLEDAIGFQNWDAAQRLVERGAKTVLGDEAALGLMDRVEARFAQIPPPKAGSINYSFWNACCAGQLTAAKYLLGKGAEINWIPDWCKESPLDGAVKSKNAELVGWLKEQGAATNGEPDEN